MSRCVSKSFKNPELTPMYRIVPKSLMMLKVPSAAFKVYLQDLAKKFYLIFIKTLSYNHKFFETYLTFANNVRFWVRK